MNVREKQLIEGIINTGDKRVHNRSIQLLFHGQDVSNKNERALYKKNEYVVALENSVRTCFSGKNYQGKFTETYMVFESLFVTYLEHIKPEKMREIDDLKNWLFVASGRFCNSNRNKINELLGIETDYDTVEYDDGSKANGHDDETIIKQECSPDSEFGFLQNSPNDVDDEVINGIADQPDSSDWAASLLDLYIGKINNAYYRELIRAIKLENVSVETIAEDFGKTPDDIYRDYNRAWDKLLQVSLPDIRIRSKLLFKKHESELDDKQTCLLNKFFFGGHDLTAMAHSEKMRQDDLEKAIVKVYKVLLRTTKRENKLEEKEKRKDEREQKQFEKKEKSLKKKGLQTQKKTKNSDR